MVLKPRDIPNAIKVSIREIPVTISAFSMGILVIPIMIVLGVRVILLIAIAATVPIMVAISAESTAITRVLESASMILRLSNIWVYHCRVKPPHCVRDFDLLKDSTIMVAMGAYRKINMRAR